MWFYGVKREHFYWFEDFDKGDYEVDSVVISFFDFILIFFLEKSNMSYLSRYQRDRV